MIKTVRFHIVVSVAVLFCLAGQGSAESYIPRKGVPINYENHLQFGYSHIVEEWIATASPSGIEEYYDAKTIFDTLMTRVTYMYYINSRFSHPDIPFDFIPYNYRTDFLEGYVGFRKGKYKYDVTGSDLWKQYEKFSGKTNFRFGLASEYHFMKAFLQGEFRIGKKELGFVFGGGQHDIRYKWGGEASLVKRYELADDPMLIGGRGFFEFTPSVYTRFVLGLGRTLFASSGDFWEMEIPLSANFVWRENWLEFSPAILYYSNEMDVKRYDLSMKICKISYTGSAYVSIGTRKYSSIYDQEDYSPSILLLALGGKYLLRDYIELGGDYVFESGDAVFEYEDEKGRSGHTFLINASMFIDLMP